MRYACLDADTRFMRILQFKISSPRKQSHFVMYRATQIVFRSISGRFPRELRPVTKGGNRHRFRVPGRCKYVLGFCFVFVFVRKIIFNYFNAKFVIFQKFWCVKFLENFWGPETGGFTLLVLVVHTDHLRPMALH